MTTEKKVTKMARAAELYQKLAVEKGQKPKETIADIMGELNISQPMASTYYYTCRARAQETAAKDPANIRERLVGYVSKRVASGKGLPTARQASKSLKLPIADVRNAGFDQVVEDVTVDTAEAAAS